MTEKKGFRGWDALLGAALGPGYDPSAELESEDALWEDDWIPGGALMIDVTPPEETDDHLKRASMDMMRAMDEAAHDATRVLLTTPRPPFRDPGPTAPADDGRRFPEPGIVIDSSGNGRVAAYDSDGTELVRAADGTWWRPGVTQRTRIT